MAPELAPELLRQLPLFQPFSDRELKGFLAPLELRHLPRGTLLHPPGEEPRSCMLVVRGALRLSVTRGGAEEQLLVLGPAQMEGDLALMDGLPQAARCEVREDATLLEMTRPRFEALRQGGDPVAFKFFDSVNRSLVGMMRRNNRTLALLAVQGRTRSAPRHGT
jgi:CRP-like cAMP-binding protein